MNRARKLLNRLSEMRGRGTGPEGTGGTDICVCPNCGHEEPHTRGIPCNEMDCPKCGRSMTGRGTVGSQE